MLGLGISLTTLSLAAGLRGGMVVEPLNPTTGDDWIFTNGTTNAWYSEATTPVAIRSGDSTYVTYESRIGATSRRIAVMAYDSLTGTWTDPHQSNVSTLGGDDHGVPSILRDHEGHLHVFGGAHNGAMQHGSSQLPDSPTTIVARTAISGAYTYPHPHLVGSGIHLFLRDDIPASTKKRLVLRKSTALAAGVPTWGAEVVLVDFGTDTRFYQAPQFQRNGEIYILATRANYLDTFRQDVYLFIYNIATGAIRNADNSVTVSSASLPLDLATAKASFRILNQETAGTYGNIPGCDMAPDGTLHVVMPQAASDTSDSLALSYFTVSPAGVVSAPVDLGTTTHRYNGPQIKVKATGEVELWYSKNTGTSFVRGGNMYRRVKSTGGVWGAEEMVRAATDAALDRPANVLGAGDDLFMLFLEVSQENNDAALRDNKGFAYGDTGYRKRGPYTLAQRSVVRPSYERRVLQDETLNTIGSIILPKLDFIYVFGAEDAQQALLNWARPTYNAMSFDCTFTPDRGFTGKGTAASYISSRFLPNTAERSVANMLRDSATFGVWPLTDGTGVQDAGIPGGANTSIYLQPRNTSNQFAARIWDNGGAALAVANTDARKLAVVTRTGSTRALNLNGAQVATDTLAASAVWGNQPLSILKLTTNYSTRQVFCAFGGGFLTEAELTQLYGALANYKAAVGA